ncbi:MAG: YicC family protein [Gammaproteobacteria bacterium]|nr:YicC family protein [Gammaproteobacteria bacterium]
MIRSMTAFARAENSSELGDLVWELRSVNHRYLDISIRLPDHLRSIESQLRTRVGKYASRGKVELGLRYQPAELTDRIELNPDKIGQLFEACTRVATTTDAPAMADITPLEILRWPGVLHESRGPDRETLAAAALTLLDSALQELKETREREGARLETMLTERLDQMAQISQQVALDMPGILAELKEKLLARLGEIKGELDPIRLEQEIVLAAQKIDVAEELDRLQAHIAEIRDVLRRNEPVGRRLDFLMQELNREANTLSSKSITTSNTRAAVDLKVLIEQMREQVQNIE